MSAARQQVRETLREAGYSVTARRIAVYDVLLQKNDHTCVEHILEALHEAHPRWRVNKTTAYRTLDIFVELGLAYEMRNADGRSQYETSMHGPHGHLLCTKCGNVQDLSHEESERLRREMGLKYGFAVDLESQAILGVCARCRMAQVA